jgi:transposase
MVKRRSRKQYDAAFKSKVALAAVSGDKTITELAKQFGVHGNLVRQWKRKLLTNVEHLFAEGGGGEREDQSELLDELYKQIGQMKVEVEWLKKKAAQFAG